MKLNEMFSHWKQVRQDLLVTIDKFNEDELMHVPFPNAWSVGRIMRHIANAEEGWFQYAVRCKYQKWPKRYQSADYPDKAAIKQLLKEVHDRTEAFLAETDITELNRSINLPWDTKRTSTLGWIVWHVLEHEIHHRGELSLVLGQLGREGLDV